MSRKKDIETWDDQSVDAKMGTRKHVITSDGIFDEQEQFPTLLQTFRRLVYVEVPCIPKNMKIWGKIEFHVLVAIRQTKMSPRLLFTTPSLQYLQFPKLSNFHLINTELFISFYTGVILVNNPNMASWWLV